MLGITPRKLILSGILVVSLFTIVLAIAYHAHTHYWLDRYIYNTKRIACVGDSITFGATIVDHRRKAYPAQLEKLLGDSFDVKNFGYGGATMISDSGTSYINTYRYQRVFNYEPHHIVLILGTNDSKPGIWNAEKFIRDYTRMINAFSAIPTRPKIWLGLPPPAFSQRWGILDQTIREEIIPIIKTLASKHGLKVIDCYSPLVGQPNKFSDNIHPNAKGARVIAETCFEELNF